MESLLKVRVPHVLQKEKKSSISCGTCNFSWLLSLDFWPTQWVTAKNHLLLFPVKGLIFGPAKSWIFSLRSRVFGGYPNPKTRLYAFHFATSLNYIKCFSLLLVSEINTIYPTHRIRHQVSVNIQQSGGWEDVASANWD